MTLDRNKTPLTHRVTAVAAAYLEGIGCKPVESEVPIPFGWIADVAGYWYPTATETRKLNLARKAREWLGLDKLHPRDVMPRVYGYGPFTVIVEVKTTRSDFVRDTRKWVQHPPAHFCFLAWPGSIIGEDELPQGWYGLKTNADGTKILKVVRDRGDCHAQHPSIVLEIVANVGIRRDHRTRYTATRDWWKAYHAKEAEKKKAYSAARLLERLANWLQGKGWKPERPLSEVLPEMGIKQVPNYVVKSIEYLESLKKAPKAGEVKL